MNLPAWLIPIAGITAFIHVAAFFACGEDVPAQDDNVFEAIQDALTFQLCEGLSPWFTWSLFLVLTVPWLLLLGTFLFQAFNNAITGTVLGVGAVLTGLVALLL